MKIHWKVFTLGTLIFVLQTNMAQASMPGDDRESPSSHSNRSKRELSSFSDKKSALNVRKKSKSLFDAFGDDENDGETEILFPSPFSIAEDVFILPEITVDPFFPNLASFDDFCSITDQNLARLETQLASATDSECVLFRNRFPHSAPSQPTLDKLDEYLLRLFVLPVGPRNTTRIMEHILPNLGTDVSAYRMTTQILLDRFPIDDDSRKELASFLSCYQSLKAQYSSYFAIEKKIKEKKELSDSAKSFLLNICPFLDNMPLNWGEMTSIHRNFTLYEHCFTNWFAQLKQLQSKRELGVFFTDLDNKIATHKGFVQTIKQTIQSLWNVEAEAHILWPLNNSFEADNLKAKWLQKRRQLNVRLNNTVHLYRRFVLSYAHSSGASINDFKHLFSAIVPTLTLKEKRLPSLQVMNSKESLEYLLQVSADNKCLFNFNMFTNQQAVQIQIGKTMADFALGDIPSLKTAIINDDQVRVNKLLNRITYLSSSKLRDFSSYVSSDSYTGSEVESYAHDLLARGEHMEGIAYLLKESHPQTNNASFNSQLYRAMVCFNLIALEIDELYKAFPPQDLKSLTKKIKVSTTNPYERYLIDGGTPDEDEDSI